MTDKDFIVIYSMSTSGKRMVEMKLTAADCCVERTVTHKEPFSSSASGATFDDDTGIMMPSTICRVITKHGAIDSISDPTNLRKQKSISEFEATSLHELMLKIVITGFDVKRSFEITDAEKQVVDLQKVIKDKDIEILQLKDTLNAITTLLKALQ